MEILLQLGANKTAFIQFALFIITISFLTKIVYGPFFKAYDERLKLTKGADQVAIETQDEAKKIQLIYQSRAREINEKIKNIFDTQKKLASQISESNLNRAKEEIVINTEKTRAELEALKNKAQQTSKTISEDVASEITKKLTGVAL
jgi:F-type H+-transporting ATPase subunit b